MTLVFGGTFVAFIIIGLTNMKIAREFEKKYDRNAFHFLGLAAFCIAFFAFVDAFHFSPTTIWLQIAAILVLGGVFMLYKKQYGIIYALAVLGYTLVYTVGVFIIMHLIRGILESINKR
jgi:hypothetical protein